MAVFWLTSNTAWAINKCVDGSGKTTYTDRPCATETKASSITVSRTSPEGPRVLPNPGLIDDNLKILQGCAAERPGPCMRKEMIEKKCQVNARGFVASNTTECNAYRQSRNRFRDLQAECGGGRRPKACAILACAGDEPEGCERMNQLQTETQADEDRRRQEAKQQGLPSGNGWYMRQNWYRQADGRLTASIACNERTSISLIKKPAALHHILTSTTGNTYFLSVDEAASKGCATALNH